MTQRLVLFDIDGTLLMSSGIGREAKRRAMMEFFGTTGDIDNLEFGGKTDWRILADLLEPEGKTVEDIGKVIGEYQDVMTRHMTAIKDEYAVTPVPYAMELVKELSARDDVVLGLVTGNMKKTAHIKLEMAGYDPAWFVVGAFGHESADRDDLSRLALKRARDLEKNPFIGTKVVVIGDTLADVQAARAVNAISVAVCTGYVHRDKLIGCDPDFLLADLSTFVDLVMV